MRLRVFDELKKVVGESGNGLAEEELEWLLKLARTNFAACYGTGTGGPDAHDAAVCALNFRLPLVAGGGQYLTQICDWLYSPAKEKCLCHAPPFITGCEHATTADVGADDFCDCPAGECPWTHHTGVFL